MENHIIIQMHININKLKCLVTIILFFVTNLLLAQKIHTESYHFYKVETAKQIDADTVITKSVRGYMTFSDLKVYINSVCYEFEYFKDFNEVLIYGNKLNSKKYQKIILNKKSINNIFNAECYYTLDNIVYVDTYYFN